MLSFLKAIFIKLLFVSVGRASHMEIIIELAESAMSYYSGASVLEPSEIAEAETIRSLALTKF